MAKSTNAIAIIAMVAAGVGLGLYFAVPAAHALSIPIFGIGAGIEITALVTRVSLWFIPWLAMGAVGLGVVVLLYEAWKNRAKVEAMLKAHADALSFLTPASTAPISVTLTHQ